MPRPDRVVTSPADVAESVRHARAAGQRADYLLGLTVVTETGEVLETDATRDPDLYWALRGASWAWGC